MSEVQPSLAPGGNGEGSTGGAAPEDTADVISKKHHERVLNELKKEREEKRILAEREAEREKKDLEAKGEYQKVIELERKRADEAAAQLAEINQKLTLGKKARALLGALDNAIPEKFHDFLPFEDVVVDPDTGEVNQTSVAKLAEQIRKDYPELMVPKNGPRFPNAAPQHNGANTISRSDWLKLDHKEMKKWKPEQVLD